MASRATSSSSASSSHSGSGNVESDLPGFYYDPEQKRYFKILPNTMSSVDSFVTRDKIKRKTAEKKRQTDIKKDNLREEKNYSKLHYHCSTNILDMLKRIQCGQSTCESIQTYMMKRTCSRLNSSTAAIKATTQDPGVTLGDVQKTLLHPDQTTFATIWSEKGSFSQILQLMSVHGVPRLDELPKPREKCRYLDEFVRIAPSGFRTIQAFNKVTALSWAPMSRYPGKKVVLYVGVCPMGINPTLASIRLFNATSLEEMRIFDFDLGNNLVWACAWNASQSRFSIGSERNCQIIDVHTRRKWVYNTQRSDPLSQAFPSTGQNLIFNGIRAGLILSHDMRASGRSHKSSVMELRHNAGVVCLNLHTDENYLTASDFEGKIWTWDLRMQKVSMSYRGLQNSHYQLPFYFDDRESLLYGGYFSDVIFSLNGATKILQINSLLGSIALASHGWQDSHYLRVRGSFMGSNNYTNIWHLKSGKLLRSIPSPIPHSVPEVLVKSLYSSSWSGLPGNEGMLVAGGDNFFFYT